MSNKLWMIYGANGYTGKLIAQEAKNRNLDPILAGRNEEDVKQIAEELNLPYRIFNLDSPENFISKIKDLHTILNCAGPFSITSRPLVAGCLDTHTNYLDITGEINVLEMIRGYYAAAIEDKVILISGIGFDVVPTDCLALKLKEALPDATKIILGFYSQGGMSVGTAITSIEGLKNGGCIRKDGQLKKVPLGYKTMEIPFTVTKKRKAVTIPWGDVSTAYYSTGIPNIEVYMCVHPKIIKKLKRSRFIQPFFTIGYVQKIMKNRVYKTHHNPSPEIRSESKSYIWGEVTNKSGDSKSAELITPNGYDLTVLSSLKIVEKVIANNIEPGVYTPSLAFGSEFITTIPGVNLIIHD